jgi:hypothetical protein
MEIGAGLPVPEAAADKASNAFFSAIDKREKLALKLFEFPARTKADIVALLV